MAARQCENCGVTVTFSCCEGFICPVCLHEQGDEISIRNDAPAEMRRIQTALTEHPRQRQASILPAVRGWTCERCHRNSLDCECA